jgi:hypothetical protein
MSGKDIREAVEAQLTFDPLALRTTIRVRRLTSVPEWHRTDGAQDG